MGPSTYLQATAHNSTVMALLSGPYLMDVVAKDMVNPSRRIVYEVRQGCLENLPLKSLGTCRSWGLGLRFLLSQRREEVDLNRDRHIL